MLELRFVLAEVVGSFLFVTARLHGTDFFYFSLRFFRFFFRV